MDEAQTVRIALVTERSDVATRVRSLLAMPARCRIELEAVGRAAAGDVLRTGRHDAWLLDADLFPAERDLLVLALDGGRPALVLMDQGNEEQEEGFLDAGAGDCLVMSELSAARLARSLRGAIRQARRLAEERERLYARKMEAISRFAGGVAHDFNNLLTAMIGYAEMLRESLAEGDERREDAIEIQRAGERATNLTRQLLTFGLRSQVQPSSLDLNEVVNRIGALLPALVGPRVQLEIVAGRGLPAINADAEQLELLIANLARNARDAMPTGGTLRIETTVADVAGERGLRQACGHAGRHVILRVADTGTGMTPEVLSHLFEPFYTTKEKGKGTGLGLAVAYGIVKQAGGKIRVESAPARGTTVTVCFPVPAQS